MGGQAIAILGLAIQAAVTYLPVEQSMKRICADVGSTLGKKPENCWPSVFGLWTSCKKPV